MSIANLFQGRIRPGYYFGDLVFVQVISWLLIKLLGAAGSNVLADLGVVIVSLVSFVLTLGLVFRRLHDINKSGWYTLWVLVPLANIVFGLWILFKSGDREANTYGPAPTHKEFFKALLNQA